MTVYLQDADVTLHHGDVLEVLRELPAESVHCCVTSPPYWQLRDYGVEGSLGLEPTPEEYVDRLVAIFGEVRRVLRPDGTVWLNLGDSYASKARGSDEGWAKSRLTNPGVLQKAQAASLRRTGERHRGKGAGLKSKDLVGIPWMVAFALRDDGWWLRAETIWEKPNVMPASVRDRPTRAHEQIFLLSKNERYFFNQDAVREPFSGKHPPTPWGKNERERNRGGRDDGYTSGTGTGWAPEGWARPEPSETLSPELPPAAPRGADGRRQTKIAGNGAGVTTHENYANRAGGERWPKQGRNLRSVWTISTEPFADAHFAVFPTELARRCILAGTPDEGVVLDPFVGSGTCAVVARSLSRRAVGIDLNADYLEMASRRLSQQSLFAP